MKRTCFGLLLALAAALILCAAGPAFAKYYKWVDEKGEVHITNNPDKIPDKYRNQVEDLTERVKKKRRQAEKDFEKQVTPEAEKLTPEEKKVAEKIQKQMKKARTTKKTKDPVEALKMYWKEANPRFKAIVVLAGALQVILYLVFIVVAFSQGQWIWGIFNFFIGPVLYLLFGWRDRPLGPRIVLVLILIASNYPLGKFAQGVMKYLAQ